MRADTLNWLGDLAIIIGLMIIAIAFIALGFVMAQHLFERLQLPEEEAGEEDKTYELEQRIAGMEQDIRQLLDDRTNKADLLNIRGRWLFYFKYKDQKDGLNQKDPIDLII
jgi:type II secretory pathway component PulJ